MTKKVNIQEVSDVLGLSPVPAPKYVLMTDERLHTQNFFEHLFGQDTNKAYYRGLQPKSKSGVIILGADADVSTPVHEAWHSWSGLGELTAWPIGDRLARRYQRLSRFPTLKNLIKRDVKYQEVSGPDEFPNLGKYAGRVKLYKLVG